MSARLDALALRRQALIGRAAAQRNALRTELIVWQRPLLLADRGVRAGRFLRAHPLILVVGVVALVAIQPTRLGIWLQRGWTASRLLYRLPLR